jgi:hypothetical protein
VPVARTDQMVQNSIKVYETKITVQKQRSEGANQSG